MVIEIIAVTLVVCGTVLAALQMYLAAATAKDIRHESARREQNKEREIERVMMVDELNARVHELEKTYKAQQWSKK